MTVISFRPEAENLNFINNKINDISKSEFINTSIKMYRNYLLRKQLREWFSLQTKEDLDLCNSDFSEYSSIIENNT